MRPCPPSAVAATPDSAPFSSRRRPVPGLLLLGAALLLASAGCGPEGQEDPAGEAARDVHPVEVVAEGTAITDARGDTLFRAEGLPAQVEVEAGSDFGSDGRLTGAELSPDGEWLALASAGTAHGLGWLVATGPGGEPGDPIPVAFQYGGSVEVLGWNPDSSHLALAIEPPSGSRTLRIVPVPPDGRWPGDRGMELEIPGTSELPPEDRRAVDARWEDGLLCFGHREERYCADPADGTVREVGQETASLRR